VIARKFIPGFKFTEDLLYTLFGSNDEKLQKAIFEEFQDLLLSVEKKVNIISVELESLGETVDLLKESQKVILTESFIDSIRNTVGDEKKNALTSAIARQVDSRYGSQEMRLYWMRQIQGLDDSEISAVKLVGDKSIVFGNFSNQKVGWAFKCDIEKWHQYREAYARRGSTKIEDFDIKRVLLDEFELLTYKDLLRKLAQKYPNWFIMKSQHSDESGYGFYSLTPIGKTLYHFMNIEL
jgi:hypothetical protein